RNSAERAAIVRVERVVAQAVPLYVSEGRARRNRQDVRGRIITERNLLVILRDAEGDVRPAGHAALPVVLVPAFVNRDLRLVAAGRDRGRLERVGAVAVRVLQ